MKRILALLMAVLLLTSILLTSCGENPDVNTDLPNDDENNNNEVVEKMPYTVKETLVDEVVMRDVYGHLRKKEGTFNAMRPNIDGTSIFCNASLINDCKLLSITVPVSKTLEPKDGCFTLTLNVYGSDYSDLKTKPKKSYEIKVAAAENGLDANKSDINKAIKVDVSSYDIVIDKNEVLGFVNAGDTLIPAALSGDDSVSKAYKLIASEAPHLGYSYNKVGSYSIAYSTDTLLFNLEWEKTYESEEDYLAIKNEQAYKDMVEALKEKYEGKYISIMGDSISTYAGVCNDSNANSTIGSNAVYYWPNSVMTMPDSSYTYWGRLINDLGMKQCVINSWSGSTVYGVNNTPNMLQRAVQLHRDNKTPNNKSDDIQPDVIIVYLGINDLHRGFHLDPDIEKRLTNEGVGSAKDKIEPWMSKVIENADKVGGATAGKTFSSVEQAYALSIRAMKEKYPDAEIYCMTLQYNYSFEETAGRTQVYERYNRFIRAIAEYFEVGIIDQAADDITYETAYQYSMDSICLHPNGAGHKKMTEYIVKTWYDELNK